MVRPRLLSPEERTRRAGACKRRWLAENCEYNRLQKRLIAARPESLARRRQLRRERQEAQRAPQLSLPAHGVGNRVLHVCTIALNLWQGLCVLSPCTRPSQCTQLVHRDAFGTLVQL